VFSYFGCALDGGILSETARAQAGVADRAPETSGGAQKDAAHLARLLVEDVHREGMT